MKLLPDNRVDASEKWNFELEDCNDIVWVDAVSTQPSAVIKKLTSAGFASDEL